MSRYPNTFDSDHAATVHGVPGRLTHRTTKPGGESGQLWTRQRWISETRPIAGYGPGAIIRAEIRFDDDCNNGHNSFAITGEVTTENRSKRGLDVIACGCLHEDIAKAFPELAPLIRWHLCSTDGPMHGIANALYHAGDRDHYGLRAGETRQIINGRSKLPAWELQAVNAPGVGISSTPTGAQYRDSATVPLFILTNRFDGLAEDLPPVPALQWVPSVHVGEGKARDLDAARSCAIWPDATDEELTQEPAALKAALEARMPQLLEDFAAAMIGAGFYMSPAAYQADHPSDGEA